MNQELPELPEGMTYLHVIVPIGLPESEEERLAIQQAATSGVLAALAEVAP